MSLGTLMDSHEDALARRAEVHGAARSQLATPAHVVFAGIGDVSARDVMIAHAAKGERNQQALRLYCCNFTD